MSSIVHKQKVRVCKKIQISNLFQNHLNLFVLSTVFQLVAFLALADARLILDADFEGSFDNLSTTALCCDHSAQLVKSPVRAGTHAVKFILNSDDKGAIYNNVYDQVVRAELVKWGESYVGDTRWYGLSVNIDPAWQDEVSDPNGTRVGSWHSNNDPGEVAKSGHLGILVKGDRWLIDNRSDPNLITTKDSFTKRIWDVGKVEKGKWVDWVVHVKWSYKSDGFLKIWKDGQLITNYQGPTTYNDLKPQLFKFGIYKAWWNHELPPRRNTLILYYDEVRIGDENSSYEEVAPKGSQSPPPAKLQPVMLKVLPGNTSE
jgi:hypothetical protein